MGDGSRDDFFERNVPFIAVKGIGGLNLTEALRSTFASSLPHVQVYEDKDGALGWSTL